MISELVSNLSILLVLSVILSYFKGLDSPLTIKSTISIGILFGVVTIIGMNFPLTYHKGLIFDGRSVIISITAFFYGPVAVLFVALLSGIYRIYIGGTGMVMGLSVITSSSIIGLIFYYLRLKGSIQKNITSFLLLGLVVHATMILLMNLLPTALTKEVFIKIAPLVLLIYIPFTLVLGLLLKEQEQKIMDRDLLVESEERYRSLFENSSFGIYRTTPDGKILLANQVLISLLGFKNFDEIKQINLEQGGFETQEQRHNFKTLIEKDGIIKGLESAWRNKNNEIIYVVEYAKIFKNKNGDVLYYEGIVEDITQKKNSEKILNENEILFRSLIEEAPVGIFQTDSFGLTTYVNPKWREISGITFKEAMSDDWINAVHPDDQKTVLEEWKKAIQKNSFSTAEYRFQWQDGTIKWVSGKAVPKKDDKGNISGYIGTATDITDRKLSEEKLKESEDRFRKLIEQAPVGIVLSDINQKTLFANKKFVELTGYTIEDHPTIDEWWPKAYPDVGYREKIKKEWIESISAALKTESEIKPMECRVTCKDGSIKYLEIGFVSIGDFNIVSFVNITDRKIIEEELINFKDRLEEKVSEQTLELNQKIKELENFKEITLNREYRIMELRKELSQLKKLNLE